MAAQFQRPAVMMLGTGGVEQELRRQQSFASHAPAQILPIQKTPARGTRAYSVVRKQGLIEVVINTMVRFVSACRCLLR